MGWTCTPHPEIPSHKDGEGGETSQNMDATHHRREHSQHVLDDRPDVVRLPLIARGIRGLEVGDDVHYILQPRRQYLLLPLELGDQVVHVGYRALGFDAAVRLR